MPTSEPPPECSISPSNSAPLFSRKFKWRLMTGEKDCSFRRLKNVRDSLIRIWSLWRRFYLHIHRGTVTVGNCLVRELCWGNGGGNVLYIPSICLSAPFLCLFGSFFSFEGGEKCRTSQSWGNSKLSLWKSDFRMISSEEMNKNEAGKDFRKRLIF